MDDNIKRYRDNPNVIFEPNEFRIPKKLKRNLNKLNAPSVAVDDYEEENDNHVVHVDVPTPDSYITGKIPTNISLSGYEKSEHPTINASKGNTEYQEELKLYHAIHRQITLYLQKLSSPWFDFACMYCDKMGGHVKPDQILKIWPDNFQVKPLWRTDEKTGHHKTLSELTLKDIQKSIQELKTIIMEDLQSTTPRVKTEASTIIKREESAEVEELYQKILRMFQSNVPERSVSSKSTSRYDVSLTVSDDIFEDSVEMFIEPTFRGRLMNGLKEVNDMCRGNYSIQKWILSPRINSDFATYLALTSSPVNTALGMRPAFNVNSQGFGGGGGPVTIVQPTTSRYVLSDIHGKLTAAREYFSRVRLNTSTGYLELNTSPFDYLTPRADYNTPMNAPWRQNNREEDESTGIVRLERGFSILR